MRQKIDIMKTRPQVSEEEIGAFMNFDSVIKSHALKIARTKRWTKFIAAATGSAIVVASLIIYFSIPDPDTLTNQTQTKTTFDPVTKHRPASPLDSVTANLNQSIKTKPASKTPSAVKDAPLEKRTIDDPKAVNDLNSAPSPVYQQAEPVNGFPHLYEYLNSQIQYPQHAISDSIQGVVTVTFIIDPAGNAGKIQIQNSLGLAFDEEARRLITNMPSWRPATLNGKPTAAKISIPLTFQIIKK